MGGDSTFPTLTFPKAKKSCHCSLANVKKQLRPSEPRSLGGQSWHGGISVQNVQTCSARWPSVAAEGELFDLYLFCLYYLSRVNKRWYKYQALQTTRRVIKLVPMLGFHASASPFIKLHYNPLNDDNTFLQQYRCWVPEERSTMKEAEDIRTLLGCPIDPNSSREKSLISIDSFIVMSERSLNSSCIHFKSKQWHLE